MKATQKQRCQYRRRQLGPVMAHETLKSYSDSSLAFRFVSKVDGTDLAEATRDLDLAETLFIVASKSFSTLKTMTNEATPWILHNHITSFENTVFYYLHSPAAGVSGACLRE